MLTLAAGCVSDSSPAPSGQATPLPEGETPPERPTEEREPGLAERPHAHDYWDGALSVTLLDENVQVMLAHNHLFDEPPREQHTHGCDETLTSTSQGGSRKFSLPEGIIVLPGTQELSFLVDWASPSVTGLRLLYRPAGQHDLADAGVITSGRPFVIPLTPEMADAGHATRTGWVFFLCADSDMPANSAEGSVHVNLIAMRGEKIPLEPPHPDWWGDATQIELASAENATTAVTALNKGEGAWIHIGLEHGRIVPPGTSRILVHVTIQDESPTKGALPTEPLLYYRDSTVPEWVYKTMDFSDGEARIDVDHNMADGVYAHESNWDFWLRLSSPEPTQTPAGTMSAPRVFDGSITLHVVAEREQVVS